MTPGNMKEDFYYPRTTSEKEISWHTETNDAKNSIFSVRYYDPTDSGSDINGWVVKPLLGGGSGSTDPGLPYDSIQFNKNGVFGGSSLFKYIYTGSTQIHGGIISGGTNDDGECPQVVKTYGNYDIGNFDSSSGKTRGTTFSALIATHNSYINKSRNVVMASNGGTIYSLKTTAEPADIYNSVITSSHISSIRGTATPNSNHSYLISENMISASRYSYIQYTGITDVRYESMMNAIIASNNVTLNNTRNTVSIACTNLTKDGTNSHEYDNRVYMPKIVLTDRGSYTSSGSYGAENGMIQITSAGNLSWYYGGAWNVASTASHAYPYDLLSEYMTLGKDNCTIEKDLVIEKDTIVNGWLMVGQQSIFYENTNHLGNINFNMSDDPGAEDFANISLVRKDDEIIGSKKCDMIYKVTGQRFDDGSYGYFYGYDNNENTEGFNFGYDNTEGAFPYIGETAKHIFLIGDNNVMEIGINNLKVNGDIQIDKIGSIIDRFNYIQNIIDKGDLNNPIIGSLQDRIVHLTNVVDFLTKEIEELKSK